MFSTVILTVMLILQDNDKTPQTITFKGLVNVYSVVVYFLVFSTINLP